MHWRGPRSTRGASRRPLRHLHEMGPLRRWGLAASISVDAVLTRWRFVAAIAALQPLRCSARPARNFVGIKRCTDINERLDHSGADTSSAAAHERAAPVSWRSKLTG